MLTCISALLACSALSCSTSSVWLVARPVLVPSAASGATLMTMSGFVALHLQANAICTVEHTAVLIQQLHNCWWLHVHLHHQLVPILIILHHHQCHARLHAPEACLTCLHPPQTCHWYQCGSAHGTSAACRGSCWSPASSMPGATTACGWCSLSKAHWWMPAAHAPAPLCWCSGVHLPPHSSAGHAQHTCWWQQAACTGGGHQRWAACGH